MRKEKPLAAALFLSALFIASPASILFAQRLGAEAALEGLKTIHPLIRYVEDGASRPDSPAERRIQLDVERMLAEAGLSVVDAAEFERLMRPRNYPIALLLMDVRVSKHPGLELHSYLLTLQIRQGVFLTRRPVVNFLGTTWENTNFGVAEDPAFVRGVARKAIERFIQEWNAQNSK